MTSNEQFSTDTESVESGGIVIPFPVGLNEDGTEMMHEHKVEADNTGLEKEARQRLAKLEAVLAKRAPWLDLKVVRDLFEGLLDPAKHGQAQFESMKRTDLQLIDSGIAEAGSRENAGYLFKDGKFVPSLHAFSMEPFLTAMKEGKMEKDAMDFVNRILWIIRERFSGDPVEWGGTGNDSLISKADFIAELQRSVDAASRPEEELGTKAMAVLLDALKVEDTTKEMTTKTRNQIVANNGQRYEMAA